MREAVTDFEHEAMVYAKSDVLVMTIQKPGEPKLYYARTRSPYYLHRPVVGYADADQARAAGAKYRDRCRAFLDDREIDWR